MKTIMVHTSYCNGQREWTSDYNKSFAPFSAIKVLGSDVGN